MSSEALVVDDEITGYFLRYQRGFPVDEASIALKVIEEVGLKGDFLGSDHTLLNYKQVLSRPLLATRMLRVKWKAQGGKTYEEAVQQKVHDILAAEPKSYLDAHQEAELERIQQAGMRAVAGT
jgi:trimethylamine--corrinoid protein Co-methyltransferase